MRLPPLPQVIVTPIVQRALAEDLGHAGDLTTDAIVDEDQMSRAAIVARQAGRIAGLSAACSAFTLLDPRVAVDLIVKDGADVAAGTVLARIEGPARAIVTAERTALNLLGHLSAIATATQTVVRAVSGTRARVVCTRKTTPGLRALQKYAVRAGGGTNHRFGVNDAVLIKDNHLALAGSVRAAVERVRAYVGHMVKIELEVDDLDQLEAAISLGVDAVLLDNMDLPTLVRAVALVGGRMITEASGGITADSAAAIASTGVNLLSVGWITHSAPNLDVALDMADALQPRRG